MWEVFNHLCSNSNDGLAKLSLLLGHGWVIASYNLMYMQLANLFNHWFQLLFMETSWEQKCTFLIFTLPAQTTYMYRLTTSPAVMPPWCVVPYRGLHSVACHVETCWLFIFYTSVKPVIQDKYRNPWAKQNDRYGALLDWIMWLGQWLTNCTLFL